MIRAMILLLSFTSSFQAVAAQRSYGTVTLNTDGAPLVVKSRKSPHAFTEHSVQMKTGDKYEVWFRNNGTGYYELTMKSKDETVSMWIRNANIRRVGKRYILDGDKMLPRQAFSLSVQPFRLEDPPAGRLVTSYRGVEVKFQGEKDHIISFLTPVDKQVNEQPTALIVPNSSEISDSQMMR